jgi:hypothetical protein
MTMPTFAQTLVVPTVVVEEAALIAAFPSATVAGWPIGAPQRDLVHSESLALQWEMVQRACVAYGSSPTLILQLGAFLISQGYSQTNAATVQSAFVDVLLEFYQSPRIAATQALWTVPLVGPGPFSVDNTSTIVLQASDGTIFQASQTSPLQATSDNGYSVSPTFVARAAGTTGNVAPNTITLAMSAPAGVNVDLTQLQVLTSPARNAESDLSALTRASGAGSGAGRWGTLSGILSASGWQYVLLTGVPTLTAVFVDDTGAGSLVLSLSDAAGPANAAEVAAAGVIVTANTIAGGPTVTWGPAAQIDVALAVTVKVDGTNPLAVAQVQSALTQLGGAVSTTLYLNRIIATVENVAGVVNMTSLSMALNGAAITPADIPRSPGSVFVLQAGPSPTPGSVAIG